MPYIKDEQREKLDATIDWLIELIKKNTDEKTQDGALNYTMTRLLKQLYTDGPPDEAGVHPTSYYRLNRARGVIVSVDDEFVRKVVIPYETQKEFENGDVW